MNAYPLRIMAVCFPMTKNTLQIVLNRVVCSGKNRSSIRELPLCPIVVILWMGRSVTAGILHTCNCRT
jgi:hypothetical protein